MKSDSGKTTQPWTQNDLEVLCARLAASKRLLDAFPGPLPSPCLLREVADNDSGDVEALALTEGVVNVGREGDSPYRFPGDRSLGRRHFRILMTSEGTCYAQDLRSKNHLWINGKEVSCRRLVHGDRIHAGNLDFVFHDGKAAELLGSIRKSGQL